MRFQSVAFALAIMTGAASHADQRVKIDVPAGGAEDLIDYKGTTPPGKGPKPSKLKLSSHCTDSRGRIHSASDPGYGDCTSARKSPASGKPGDQTAPGVSIDLGSP